MKNSIFIKRFAICTLSFALCLLLLESCGDNVVKLTVNDRVAIDTLSAKIIKNLTPELEKQCQDSADVLRKRMVDSFVTVRQREIIMQTLPTH